MSIPETDRSLRELIVRMLREPNAHLRPEEILGGFSARMRGTKPPGFSRSAWELLEHLRIAQEDILKFSVDPDYESPDWPEGYWPSESAPKSPSDWSSSVAAFGRDLDAMTDLIQDESNDLQRPFAHGDGQTLLREAVLLMKHNSYHLGQLMTLRRYLEATA